MIRTFHRLVFENRIFGSIAGCYLFLLVNPGENVYLFL
jgi:hypothetical protein